MLNAILAGKKRGTGLEGQSLALGQTPGAEDVLTASVFERLAYLPDDVFSQVMSKLLGVADFAALQQLEFWPRWHLHGSLVEPDVLLSDGAYQVLVEAKRFDFAQQQYPSQLARELQAGWAEDALTGECTLLTLGGLSQYSAQAEQQLKQQIDALLQPEETQRYRLVCRSWQQLHEVLTLIIGEHASPGSGPERMLADITQAYTWHQLRTHSTRWFSDMLGADLHNQAMPEHWTWRTQTTQRLPGLAELPSVALSALPGHFDHWRNT